MNTAIQHVIKENNLFTKKDKLLLGISGGADSVCLMHVLLDLGYKIELAHCNFNLRGEESDNDEIFVRQLAEKHNLKIHVKSFDTQKYASNNKISTQMAARDLRYKWFQELLISQSADYIMVAHHANDDVETFIINLLRGTGIKGMLGIKMKSNKIVRPFLSVSRLDIENYLKEFNHDFREDSSNKSVKYLRNKVRHKVIPLLKEINPSVEQTIKDEMQILNGINEIYTNDILSKKEQLLVVENEKIIIEIEKILELQPIQNYLFEFLSPFGFLEIEAIIKSVESGESGKLFFSKTHQLNIDRKHIIICPLGEELEEEYTIDVAKENIDTPVYLKLFVSENKEIKRNKEIAQLDFDKLTFPLTLRKWRKGDRFVPLGMNSFKKLSDFFIDNKFSILEKQQQWLLCSGKDIVWIVGSRIDDRYKVESNTKKVYIAQLLKR